MTTLPGLPMITVNGPFWSAEMAVVTVTTPSTSGPIILLATNFDELSPGQNPLYWQDTKADNSFDVDDSLFATAAVNTAGKRTLAFGTAVAETNIHSHYVAPGALDWTDYTVTGRLYISHKNGGVGITVLSQFPQGRDDYYRLRTVRNQPNFHLSPHRNGIGSVDWGAAADTGVAAEPNTWYRFHLVVEDQQTQTMIRAKVWPEGTDEPATFQVERADDSEKRLRTGTVGVWAAHAGAKYVDDLRVVTNSASHPLRQALQPTLFAEDFTTYSAGEDPTRWFDSGPNNSTEHDEKQFKTRRVAGAMAFGCRTHDDDVHSHVVMPGADQWTNYAYSGLMYAGDDNVGVTFFSSYPTPGHDDYYALRADDDHRTFHITAHPTGKRTVNANGSDSGIKLDDESWYHFYIEAEDNGTRTNIRAKVWRDGTPEPASFQMSTYDDGPNRLRSGTIGLWSDDEGDSYYRDLRVQALLRQSSGLRTLFLNQHPRAALGEKAILLPGTLIALCVPLRVTIQPTAKNSPTYRWAAKQTPQLVYTTAAEIKRMIDRGELSLLLLQADPTAWPRQAGTLPPFSCLNGQINLDKLQENGNDRSALYKALTLEESATATAERMGALGGALSVHSSGATLLGTMQLPWLPTGQRVTAPFQLARTLAPDQAGNATLQPSYRLSIERERLTDDERRALIRTWRALSILINPRNPLHGPDYTDADTTFWSTLEIVDPLHVPNIFWLITAWRATPQVRFAAGEFHLLLTDRQTYSDVAPPTSLATIVPNAEIPLTVSHNGNELTIELTVGAPPDSSEQQVHYRAERSRQTEEITFPHLPLAFDPIETARFLRDTLEITPPEGITDGDPKLQETPLLWGFMPVEDGWVQFPVPNMTEQLYFQAQASAATLTASGAASEQTATDDETGTSSFIPILQGAVAWGNSYTDTLTEHPSEQAWDLTLTGTSHVHGAWTLVRVDESHPFVLEQVVIEIAAPEIIANGFCFFSTSRPTAADALPDLTNWITGLRQLSLRSVSRIPRSLPPLVHVDFQAVTLTLRQDSTGPSAHLNQWRLRSHLDDATAAQLGEAGAIVAKAVDAHPPLLWRRHPSLPTIQALPLTQTLVPPNSPNASRQLAPYQPTIGGLTLEWGVLPAENSTRSAAAYWPRIFGDFTPADEWRCRHDLPMAMLSLPGLYLDPDDDLPLAGLQADVAALLPLRYRYDLPYTDELNALAQVPKEPRDPNEVSPLPDSPQPQPPTPLMRTTLVDYWRQLSNQATLAAVSAANALVAIDGQLCVYRLIEPYYWPVTATLTLANYPGQLVLDNVDGQPSAPLQLTGEAALAGIAGPFTEKADGSSQLVRQLTATDTSYMIHAGAMRSHGSSQGMRDQRGLMRSVSRLAPQNPQLLFTEVTLHDEHNVNEAATTEHNAHTYRLLSLMRPLPLDLPGASNWHFWMKDLPALATGTDGDATYRFERTNVLSPVLKAAEPPTQPGKSIAGINDPEALAREQNYRLGYEWRLGRAAANQNDGDGNDDGNGNGKSDVADLTAGEGDAAQPLLLNGLQFYPLTLEALQTDDEVISRIEIVGRLQLPLSQGAELRDLSNAVRLIFTTVGADPTAALVLSGIQIESPVVEWPLQMAADELTNAPRIVWNAIHLNEQQEIVVGNQNTAGVGAWCRFVLFGQEWAVPLGEIVFSPRNTVTLDPPRTLTDETVVRALLPYQLDLTLNTVSGNHSAALQLLIRAGLSAVPALRALVQFRLIEPVAIAETTGDTAATEGVDAAVVLLSATLFGRLAIQTGKQSIQSVAQGLQFVWEGCESLSIDNGSTAHESPHFLPGMPLQMAKCPGFLALTFTALPPVAESDPAIRIPELQLRSAFVETVLTTSWGIFLHDPIAQGASWQQRAERLFGSSAGEINVGFTAQWQQNATQPDPDGGMWEESFLLNGFLEVTNLLSWPAQLTVTEGEQTFIVPAIEQTPDLAHLRHTIRLLLNQHVLPNHLLIRQQQHANGTTASAPTLFRLTQERPWQFLAITEHQLLEVQLATPNPAETATPSDVPTAHFPWERRWTALQEVRLLSPQSYRAFLADQDLKVIDPVIGIAPRWTLFGHYLQGWVQQLTADSAPDALQRLDDELMLVEASAPHWVRTQSVETLSAIKDNLTETAAPILAATTLQFLPNGSQAAILSDIEDFGPSQMGTSDWQLLTMPFLGRIQPVSLDGIANELEPEEGSMGAPDQAIHPFHVDPMLQLWRHREQENRLISPLLPMLTSWALDEERAFAFSAFEHAISRTWSRLDPLSVEENWFRLQNPPVEPTFTRLQSVMAALPDTPARLSRAAALTKAFDAFRAYYPPQLVAAEPMAQEDASVTWRQQSIMVWQSDLLLEQGGGSSFPWLPIALQLHTSPLRSTDNATPQPHHAAATLLPAQLQINDKANPVPVSFAVSPYLGLAYRPAPTRPMLFLASLELLGLDASSNVLRPIASILHEENDEQTLHTWAALWAAETRLRLRPDSALGVVRLRQLHKTGESIDEHADETGVVQRRSPLIATYTFALIQQSTQQSPLSQRVIALRSLLAELRFREGQYGGSAMPTALKPFEIAPPLTNEVLPIYLLPQSSESAFTTHWPWGVSALAVGVQYTEGKLGITGKAPQGTAHVINTQTNGDESPHTDADASRNVNTQAAVVPYTLWWHAPHHQVQFRSTLSDDGPTAGLPPLFRAAAIKSLLPTLPALRFPTVAALQTSDRAETLASWQPVLPGALHYLLVGARPGAMLAMRNQLLRQRGLALGGSNAPQTESLVSGSIPVQHRVPRPVPLPANTAARRETALQTWAGYGKPSATVLVLPTPVDETFFAECSHGDGKEPQQIVQVTLSNPSRGMIDRQWTGYTELMLWDQSGQPASIEDWDLQVEIYIESIAIRCSMDPDASHNNAFVCTPDELALLRRLVSLPKAGETILLLAHVKPKARENNFRQTLSFPLRIGDAQQIRLPIEPRFTYFEDPEYNRRLASLAGRVAKPMQFSDGKMLTLITALVSTDRREYNPDSTIWVRFDLDDPRWQKQEQSTAQVSLQKADRNNTIFPLALPNGQETTMLQTGEYQLLALPLAKLTPQNADDPNAIRPGDSILVTVQLLATAFQGSQGADGEPPPPSLVKDDQLTLRVNIVAEPVIPKPEAAYALLRSHTVNGKAVVECVRFAWGPEADRVELICPDDLTQEVVRRRAVFKWQDSIRLSAESEPRYAIQKIAQNGATHFPQFD